MKQVCTGWKLDIVARMQGLKRRAGETDGQLRVRVRDEALKKLERFYRISP